MTRGRSTYEINLTRHRKGKSALKKGSIYTFGWTKNSEVGVASYYNQKSKARITKRRQGCNLFRPL